MANVKLGVKSIKQAPAVCEACRLLLLLLPFADRSCLIRPAGARGMKVATTRAGLVYPPRLLNRGGSHRIIAWRYR